MKTCSNFQQAGQPAANLNVAFGGIGDAGHYLEQGALARTITAHNADNIARIHIKGDIAESPEAFLSD